MQRMCKQSPKQSVGLHDIRLHTKKAQLPKITWTYRGGGGRPLRLPPGSATDSIGHWSHNGVEEHKTDLAGRG